MKLIADNLTVDRGGRRVFAGLSFSLESGNALVVTGANGVGKSSLLRTLAGLVVQVEGKITLDGGQADLTVPEHTHYFGHQSAIKPALSVLENLSFWRDFTAPARAAPFAAPAYGLNDILELLGIGHTADLPAAYLSAGQTRRLALARLFVSPRPIWLMDEPTSALDTAAEAQLIGLMNDHLSDGGMIITATHTRLGLSPLHVLHLETLAADDAMTFDDSFGDMQ
ncbi:heme ABC exporter ATP-binding protein CcmA [Roseibium algae]|uniref:Heme ABC exporter ATP-binding protein CcmA n=1 Tax=Roseibium algae TaxID=3123038 RepID=A0ABU8TR62_9HYPH